jgi:DNA-binding winged helix-turn-helix (wHTH) protein
VSLSLVKSAETPQGEPTAFLALLYLLRNPERLVTKDEIFKAVWSDYAVSDNSLTPSYCDIAPIVAMIRGEPSYIATVSRVGYGFYAT